MRLSGEQIGMFDLVQRFLREGTFTLKGVDVSRFIETRIFLKDFVEKNSGLNDVTPKVEPLTKPHAKPLRKKKVK